MLITSRLNHCKGCDDLKSIIDQLDCYITDRMLIILNNKRFSLNKKINTENLKDAITYKSILIKRSINPNYICNVDINDIIKLAKESTYQ